MPDLSIGFKVTNTPVPAEELSATLYRAPGAHPDRLDSVEGLSELINVTIRKSGLVRFRLSETDIEKMQEGDKKVIYLAFAIMQGKKPIFISGAFLLARLRELGPFILDMKTGEISAANVDPGETENTETDKPVPSDIEIKTYAPHEKAERDLVQREESNEKVRQLQKPRLLNGIKQRDRSRKFIKDLMLNTTGGGKRGKGKGYVPPKTNPESTLRDNVTSGLRRLEGTAWRGMALHLTEDFLKQLDIPLKKDWTQLTERDWGKIRNKLGSDTVMKRRKQLLSGCMTKRKTQAFFQEIDGKADTQNQPVVVTNQPAGTDLESAYTQLCAELSGNTSVENRPGTAEIEEAVKASISAGPADTTAYYDFHTLQIAWDDTWTSVYDDYTEKEVTKVYNEIVQTVGSEVTDVIENVEYTELMEFLDDLGNTVEDAQNLPGRTAPADLVAWLPEAKIIWPYLSDDDRLYLQCLYDIAKLDDKIDYIPLMPDHKYNVIRNIINGTYSERFADTIPSTRNLNYSGWAIDQANNIVDSVDMEETPENLGLGRLGRMLDGIHKRLYMEPYEFDIFAPNTYNFGLVHTYQQTWKPLNYQVGDLISTMPLAPGEKKTYTVTEKFNSSDSSTRKQASSMKSNRESSSTNRSQADIVAKATYSAAGATTVNTNFGLKIGVFNGGANTSSTASGNAASESQSTKQNIRENTLTAAQEYTDEHSVEISTKIERSNETVMTSEISNPNNEITVTYLFYELQRRFEVSSRLDKLTPVVMFAFDVPQPSEIDEDWLLTYDWILRKALLDPKLAAGLDYIRQGLAGDELSVEIFRTQWEVQVAAVQRLSANLQTHTTLRDMTREALQDASELVADKFDLGDAAQLGIASTLPALGFMAGPLGVIAGAATGGLLANDAISSDLTKDEIAATQESARLGLEWANSDYNEAYSNVKEAVYALEKATQKYADAISRRQKMRTVIDQLRIHVKENVLYYMQAIWAHEPPDQRYFRVYNKPIIWPRANGLPQMRSVEYPPDPAAVAAAEALQEHFDSIPFFDVEVQIPGPEIVQEFPTRQLHEVADLDNLLGFKGNYAIFPLKKHNAVTNYMSQEFLDDYFGITDPHREGNIPTETEALEIAECMWKRAGDDEAKRARVVRWLTEVLQNQIFVSDEVVVPSGELFIEALPGSHPLLEDFKLRHRAVDLAKATQELTNARVETIRHVKRLLEDDLSDPDIDTNIKVDGGDASVVVTTE